MQNSRMSITAVMRGAKRFLGAPARAAHDTLWISKGIRFTLVFWKTGGKLNCFPRIGNCATIGRLLQAKAILKGYYACLVRCLLHG